MQEKKLINYMHSALVSAYGLKNEAHVYHTVAFKY